MKLSEAYIQKYQSIEEPGMPEYTWIAALDLPDLLRIAKLEAKTEYINDLNNSGVNDKSIDIDLKYYKSELNKLKNDHGL